MEEITLESHVEYPYNPRHGVQLGNAQCNCYGIMSNDSQVSQVSNDGEVMRSDNAAG